MYDCLICHYRLYNVINQHKPQQKGDESIFTTHAFVQVMILLTNFGLLIIDRVSFLIMTEFELVCDSKNSHS